ncbi:Sec-independent protein translocase subunit TatA [Cellulosimicrobium arenosum]|uniref:Sec-independent protein translocase protein TatA n=1 Tax=Cellulosimicrobium arenosum TaxID=2708133 RepID=A0A927IYZ3_9MICO|nr:Sec-independent protein translocase subunit TatA [Cellulosimicrobium arenosum]MBD8077812.1 Sec-independent protein translocase subunit TatA [Cellulosimicrobium arenosum]
MGMLKPWHIIVLVVVVLLLFGARRLPDLARSVGQSLKIFKSEVKDLRDDKDDDGHAAKDEAAPYGTTTTAAPGTPTNGTGSPTVPGGSSTSPSDDAPQR